MKPECTGYLCEDRRRCGIGHRAYAQALTTHGIPWIERSCLLKVGFGRLGLSEFRQRASHQKIG